MNFKNFFHSPIFYGKLLGALFGYLIAGPVGALFGILIGNLFDKALGDYFTKQHWPYHAEKRKKVQGIFFQATFSIMGNLAKIDGPVTPEQIRMAVQLMEELELSKPQKNLAKQYFRSGKQGNFDLWGTLNQLRQATRDNPALLKLFLDIQYRTIQVNGLSFKKLKLMNAILNYLGFAPLHHQYQFYEDYQSQTRSQSSQYNAAYNTHNQLAHAYAILGVSQNASKPEVKKAYQRLISRNHPDKLISQGLPEELIKIANEKTQSIRKAYEEICKYHNW